MVVVDIIVGMGACASNGVILMCGVIEEPFEAINIVNGDIKKSKGETLAKRILRY